MLALREQARGRWPAILSSIGVPMNRLNGKHGPCPICRQGKDRFRFDDIEGRGTWICNQCGAGDGISFVQKVRGVDFLGAVALIEPLIGAARALPIRQGTSAAGERRWRNELWKGARPITKEDAAGRFLHFRAGVFSYPSVLRFHPDLLHVDDDGRRSRHPGMIAIVSGPTGRPENLHRTYLTAEGDKAALEEPRLMMPGQIPDGAAIRLSPVAEVLGIAEGIETAFAVTALFGVPCWSALSAGILAKWVAPPEVKYVMVFGDNDKNFTGQAAAYALARSLVKQRMAQIDIHIPEEQGTDWNDVLLKKG